MEIKKWYSKDGQALLDRLDIAKRKDEVVYYFKSSTANAKKFLVDHYRTNGAIGTLRINDDILMRRADKDNYLVFGTEDARKIAYTSKKFELEARLKQNELERKLIMQEMEDLK